MERGSVRRTSGGRVICGTGRSVGAVMGAKYWSTQRSSWAGSKLPDTIRVAVEGR